MKNLKNNVYFKIGAIVILIIVLLIPAVMVKGLITEREKTHQSAINEVNDKWANGQTISGPYISVPYYKTSKQYSEKTKQYKTVKIKDWIYFMPETLNIEGDIKNQTRKRSIYEIVVYNSNLKMAGSFEKLDIKQHNIDPEDVIWENATLNIGISDLKGIENQIELKWDTSSTLFKSGTSTNDIVYNGINAEIPVNMDSTSYEFSLKLGLKGSQFISFTPLGKTTDLVLTSDWKDNSFMGNFLPDTNKKLANGGSMAHWNIIHLNRNYPQSWTGNKYSVQESVFGTNLMIPVDNYQKSYRVARYAILFLVLTFMVFFFVEMLKKIFIHPIQYLLVGIAIIVFYCLLLAFSEHIDFNSSYIISAVLTLSLITFYISTSVKSKEIGVLTFGLLAILYTFIFTIIQIQDYALLIGSMGVFTILAFVMFFSRKIDWYDIKIGGEDKNNVEENESTLE
ncbi:MAG: cell envelope integrity protein CreD [Flavobacteriales bacterium]